MLFVYDDIAMKYIKMVWNLTNLIGRIASDITDISMQHHYKEMTACSNYKCVSFSIILSHAYFPSFPQWNAMLEFIVFE